MNFNKNKFGYIFTLLSVLLTTILYWAGSYDNLEKRIYDYKFNLRGPLSSSNPNFHQEYLFSKSIKYDYVNDNDIKKIISDSVSLSNIISNTITDTPASTKLSTALAQIKPLS